MIPLHVRDGSVRAYAIVDAVDAEWVSRWRWSLGKNGYTYRSGIHGKIRLHRALLGLKRGDGLDGDHINRDRLDHRRANLRSIPRAASAQNVGPRRRSSSRYRGVAWRPEVNKWRAVVRADGRTRTLGYFVSEEEAAEVARAARARLMPYAVD